MKQIVTEQVIAYYSERSTRKTIAESREFDSKGLGHRIPAWGNEPYEFEVGDKVIATGTGGYKTGHKMVVTDRHKLNGYVRYLGGNIYHKKGDLIADGSSPKKPKAESKKAALKRGHVKPSKVHYNRYLKKILDTEIEYTATEAITFLFASTHKDVTTNDTLPSHYPSELALIYGIREGLLVIGTEKAANGYYPVFLTGKGLRLRNK